MTVSKTVAPVTASNADVDMSLVFFVGPGGYPGDLRVRLILQRSDNTSEVVELAASAVPRTLSGITALQASNFLKDCRNACLTAAGYT